RLVASNTISMRAPSNFRNKPRSRRVATRSPVTTSSTTSRNSASMPGRPAKANRGSRSYTPRAIPKLPKTMIRHRKPAMMSRTRGKTIDEYSERSGYFQELQISRSRQGTLPRNHQRRSSWATRSERRRQDDSLLHDSGADSLRQGKDPSRRPRPHGAADASPRRHGTGLPAPGSIDFSQTDGRTEHPGDPGEPQ